MATQVNSLPGRYAGRIFRSQLESEWAAFFDRGSLRWEYEPVVMQGADGHKWIPDFSIGLDWPEQTDVLVEVKPRIEFDRDNGLDVRRRVELAAWTDGADFMREMGILSFVSRQARAQRRAASRPALMLIFGKPRDPVVFFGWAGRWIFVEWGYCAKCGYAGLMSAADRRCHRDLDHWRVSLDLERHVEIYCGGVLMPVQFPAT